MIAVTLFPGYLTPGDLARAEQAIAALSARHDENQRWLQEHDDVFKMVTESTESRRAAWSAQGWQIGAEAPATMRTFILSSGELDSLDGLCHETRFVNVCLVSVSSPR